MFGNNTGRSASVSDEIENYSIDEAFAIIERNDYLQPLFDSGVEIWAAVKRWTGIPTYIRIAQTKTLTKIASKIAKRSRLELTDPDLRDEVLSNTELVDTWGINKRTAAKLVDLGIQRRPEDRQR